MKITDAAAFASPVKAEVTENSPPASAARTSVQASAPAAAQPQSRVTDVQTHFDAMSGMLVASVVDKETGAVVTEVPPEGLRALAMRTAEFRGKLFNVKL